MKEIVSTTPKGEEPKGWIIRSGYEAQVIGRVATYGKKDTTPNVRICHDGEVRPAYDDEVEFVRRTAEHEGREPTIDAVTARLAEAGLRSIVATKKIYRSVTPEEAAVFLSVLDAGRQARQIGEQLESVESEGLGAEDATAQPPSLDVIESDPRPIRVIRQAKQAA